MRPVTRRRSLVAMLLVSVGATAIACGSGERIDEGSGGTMPRGGTTVGTVTPGTMTPGSVTPGTEAPGTTVTTIAPTTTITAETTSTVAPPATP